MKDVASFTINNKKDVITQSLSVAEVTSNVSMVRLLNFQFHRTINVSF